MQRPIIKRGDILLEQVCEPVVDVDQVKEIITDLSDTVAAIRKLISGEVMVWRRLKLAN